MLNNIGLPGILLIAVVVLVMFGRGKISSLMGEVGKGITAFKKGVNDSKKEIEEEKRIMQQIEQEMLKESKKLVRKENDIEIDKRTPRYQNYKEDKAIKE